MLKILHTSEDVEQLELSNTVSHYADFHRCYGK